jgi:uncharacterized membrane protein
MAAGAGPASRAPNRLPLVSRSRVADVLRSAVWLVPALCVAGAIALAVVLIVVDADLHPSGGVLLFPGPPAGARSFLSAIVQAMISFTAVVFSITVVVLQLSSGQYSRGCYAASCGTGSSRPRSASSSRRSPTRWWCCAR